jgi:cyclic pyranopterin phosphate synthase
MPENGAPLSPKEHLLTTDEIVRLAGLFVKNGVRKIRLTGGEPTVRRDLPEIVGKSHVATLSSLGISADLSRFTIERLSALGLESLGMTSNGLALARKLPGLVEAGLTSLNISLDTLDEHKFELMTRRRGHSAVLNAIKQAASLHASSSPSSSSMPGRRLKNLKLNVVVINGLNDAEVPAFVELTQDLPISVRFIEYMPFSDNRWSTSKLVPSADLLAKISAQHPIGTVKAITPGISDTAREYTVQGYKGSFGFISSMTDHFCSGCSRLRIQADGGMKVSLYIICLVMAEKRANGNCLD